MLYSLKIDELIQSSQAGIFFFSTQFLLKMLAFELNNGFVFYGTLAVNMQSILEFLQLIHDCLASDNTIRSFVYIFPAV